MTGDKGSEDVELDFSWMVCTGGVSELSPEVSASGENSTGGEDGGGDSWLASGAARSE